MMDPNEAEGQTFDPAEDFRAARAAAEAAADAMRQQIAEAERAQAAPQVQIVHNTILHAPIPDAPHTIYDRRLTNGQAFICITPANTAEGLPVLVLDTGGGMDPLEIAQTLGDVSATLFHYWQNALAPGHDCPEDFPKSIDAEGNVHCALCGTVVGATDVAECGPDCECKERKEAAEVECSE